ncbi:MAG: class I adenylate-forming enzyme family protein [Acidimicrobiales bacterium]
MLLAVSLPPQEAADAIRRAWDRGDAVAVGDPAALHVDEPVDPSVAAVVATSGTTGEPRAVELTWDGLHAMALAVETAPHDRWLACLPFHHVAGLAVLARSWATGTPVTVVERFEDGTGATLVSLVPTQVRRLLAAHVDLSPFRLILVGGGPVPDDIRALPNTVATYGMTETWGGVVHDGHPLTGVEITLAPDDREILVRSPTVMRGYRGDEHATAAAFTEDGRLRTGDIGRWAPDGRLEVVDRKRDIVITGGVNVSPGEVERALAGHPAVADVCVAGAPDDEWGERVVAFVVPEDPTDPPRLAELRDYARGRLSPAQLPREVVIVDAVPRTAGGKPVRRHLLERR